LGVEMDEAASFVENYYAQFPKLKNFLAAQVDRAKVDGFTTTMFGRRRYLPELQSANFRLRALGERMALNAPIQGSAADILKKAMIGVDRALRREPIAKMLLTVHDELVFEVPAENLERARALIEKEMTGAAELRCGLAVDVHSGASRAEAHASALAAGSKRRAEFLIDRRGRFWYALATIGGFMPPRALGSGAISFGLVSIPVKLYLAATSGAPSFNLLHARCGNRIRQQRFCPVCNAVVERDDLIRGYEVSKDQYVQV